MTRKKRKHSITNHCPSSESAAVPDSTANEWIADLPNTIQNFNLNCDETD